MISSMAAYKAERMAVCRNRLVYRLRLRQLGYPTSDAGMALLLDALDGMAGVW